MWNETSARSASKIKIVFPVEKNAPLHPLNFFGQGNFQNSDVTFRCNNRFAARTVSLQELRLSLDQPVVMHQSRT